jgi:hypothetical protein
MELLRPGVLPTGVERFAMELCFARYPVELPSPASDLVQTVE